MAKLTILRKQGQYGVVDECGNEIIPFEYTVLRFLFDDLFVFSKSHESDPLLGVIDDKGEVIIPCSYDVISPLQHYIVVGKDRKLGILNKKGGIIINPSYSRIECVLINDNKQGEFSEPHPKYKNDEMDQLLGDGWPDFIAGRYDSYNNNNVLDTDNPHSDMLYHLELKCIPTTNGADNLNPFFENHFDLSKPFILSTGSNDDLFTINDGYFPNSRSQMILPLSERFFAVKRNERWGVYSITSGALVIGCDYDRLIFKGGSIVYLCNNNSWGIKSFDRDVKSPSYVDIPCDYPEVKALDIDCQFFGVKKLEKYYLVDAQGKEFESCGLGTDSQFEYSLQDRFLTSVNGKWGFISLDSNCYDIIPFIYDLAEKRKDGFYDVKIGDKWGVLAVDGREIVSVKYNERIPTPIAGSIVSCSRERPCYAFNTSDVRFGVLSENGSELIPTIYNHIVKEDVFYWVCFDGFEEDGNMYGIRGGQWGCCGINGELLIKPLYGCLCLKDGFILAGRNGSFYDNDYTGVYDLYSTSGELIIGGFHDFYYTKGDTLHTGVFHFLINRYWVRHVETDSGQWGSISYYSPDDSDAKWLELDEGLSSIKVNNNGEHVTFEKGFVVSIKRNSKGFSYNFDDSVL